MKKYLATFVLVTLVLGTSLESLGQNPERKKITNQSRGMARAMAKLVAHGGGMLLSGHPDEADLPRPLARWLGEHSETIYGAGPSPFEKFTKWGVATTKGNKLFLHVGAWPKDGKLLIPRLHNSIKSAKLVGGDEKELKVTPNVADWAIALGEKPKRNIMPVIAVELNEPAKLGQTEPPTVKQAGDAVELHARYSVVHGEMLRFEPQAHKNTVGYWVKEKDWAEWQCMPNKTGTFEVTLRYGCGNGQGGSDIEISIGKQKLPFKVEATGGFQAWRDVKLGSVELKANTGYAVSAKVIKKAKNAVMDIQQITLTAK